MVGEYKVAKEVVAKVITDAENQNDMCTDAMANAMFTSILGHMIKTNDRKALEHLFYYSLDSLDEDEFLVTRGC